MKGKAGGNGRELLKKQIKEGALSGVYLLTGEERYLIGLYIERIKKLFCVSGPEEFNIITFEGAPSNAQDVAAAIDSLPVMADKKLVIFKDTGAFGLSPGPLKPVLEKLLENPPDYVVAVFDEPNVDGRSALLKKLKSCGVYAEFRFLKPAELHKWVGQEFSRMGKKISPSDAAALVENCEEGLSSVKNEIDKLISYIGERKEVTRADIEAVVPKSVQNRLFEMVDAIVEKRGEEALSLLYGLKELKEPPVKIIAVLGQHMAYLVKAKLLKGEDYDELSKFLKPAFLVGKYVKQAKKTDMHFLSAALEKCCETDYMIKTGGINDWVGLEMLVAFLLE